MNIPRELLLSIDAFADRAESLGQAAQYLAAQHPHVALPHLAVALRQIQQSLDARGVLGGATAGGATTGGVSLNEVIKLAQALLAAKPGAQPEEMAEALRSPGVYPELSAVQLGQVLKADGVYPTISADTMGKALGAAGYSPEETDGAVRDLFPAPPARQTRRIGPVGNQEMAFDDTDAAQQLGQPLTKIRVASGNVVDSIQAYYGPEQSPLTRHGGTGGGPTEFAVSDSDPIVNISGFYGSWFGGRYILQLSFRTASGQTHGPFGNMSFAGSQTPFSLDLAAGERIVAFFGATAYGNNRQSIFLGALGVTVQS